VRSSATSLGRVEGERAHRPAGHHVRTRPEEMSWLLERCPAKRSSSSVRRSMPPTTPTEKTRRGPHLAPVPVAPSWGSAPHRRPVGRDRPQGSWRRWGSSGRAWSRPPGWRSVTGRAHKAISTSTSPPPWSDSMAAGWKSGRIEANPLPSCAEFEHAYGLTVVEGREGRGMPGLTRAELERTAREHLAEPPRITLARWCARHRSPQRRSRVRPTAAGSGALVRPRFETGGKEAVVGYSVALRTGVEPRRSGSAAGSWPRT
jgi:hypothetical protein